MLDQDRITSDYLDDVYPRDEMKILHSTVKVHCFYDKDHKSYPVEIKVWEYLFSPFPNGLRFHAEPSMTFQGQGQASPYVDSHPYATPEEAIRNCLVSIVGFGNSPRTPILIDEDGYKTWDEEKQCWTLK